MDLVSPLSSHRQKLLGWRWGEDSDEKEDRVLGSE